MTSFTMGFDRKGEIIQGLPNLVTLMKIFFNKILYPVQTLYKPESVIHKGLWQEVENNSKGYQIW